ncbi:MAG: glycerophosphodiester phosphodiesterase family protein [Marmoricola sp.]
MDMLVPRTRRRALSALLVGLLAVAATPLLGHVERASSSSVAEAVKNRPHVASHPKVLVIAHRGFSAIAPENTLPAMAAAAKAQADMVEFDVQRTLDGHLIVIHDRTFARTTDIARVFPARVNNPVGSFTLADVQRLDAGSWKGTRFAGTRVPTLDQLLTTMRPTSTNLLLELKNPSLYPGYESQVAAALVARGFTQAGRVYVHSFGRSSLETFHRAAPSVPLGLLTKGPLSPEGIDSWMHTVNPATGSVTDAGVDWASAANLQVFTWPLNLIQRSAPQIERMVDDGVSGIITDNPLLVRHLVGSGTRA